MQSGSLYFGEFTFGETGATVTAASRHASTVGLSPASQGKKLSRASITGIPLSLGRIAEEEAGSANAYFWEVATVAAS